MPCCGGVGVLVAIRPSPPTLTDALATTARLSSKLTDCTVIREGSMLKDWNTLPTNSGALRDCAVGAEWREDERRMK
jgi:hypothetical protein